MERPIGKVVITPKGVYNSDTEYEKLDLVIHEGSSYISKTNNNINNTPSGENNTYWQRIAEKGTNGATGNTGPAGSPGLTLDAYSYEYTTTDSIQEQPAQNAVWGDLNTIVIPYGKALWTKTKVTTKNSNNEPVNFDIISPTYVGMDGVSVSHFKNYLVTETVEIKGPINFNVFPDENIDIDGSAQYIYSNKESKNIKIIISLPKGIGAIYKFLTVTNVIFNNGTCPHNILNIHHATTSEIEPNNKYYDLNYIELFSTGSIEWHNFGLESQKIIVEYLVVQNFDDLCYVQFITNGGIVESGNLLQYVHENDIIENPPVITREGYTSTWSRNLADPITENTIIYPIWTKNNP